MAAPPHRPLNGIGVNGSSSTTSPLSSTPIKAVNRGSTSTSRSSFNPSTSTAASPPPIRTAAQIKAENEKRLNPIVASNSLKGKGKQVALVNSNSSNSTSKLKPSSAATQPSTSTSTSNSNLNPLSPSLPISNQVSHSRTQSLQQLPTASTSTSISDSPPASAYAHRKKSSKSHIRTQSTASSVSNSGPPSRTTSPFNRSMAPHLSIPSHAAWSGGSGAGLASYASTSNSNLNSNGSNTPTSIRSGINFEEQDSVQQNPTLPFGIAGNLGATSAGFQPRGVFRDRFEEFEKLRRGAGDKEKNVEGSKKVRKREEREREEGRLERRLEKLLALHYEPETTPLGSIPESTSSIISNFSSLSKSRSRLLGLGANLGVGSVAQRSRELRNLEKNVVPWEEDAKVKQCPICETPFTLAIRKHHCRLCGRVVCASPSIGLPNFPPTSNEATKEETKLSTRKCSGLMVLCEPPIIINSIDGEKLLSDSNSDSKWGKIRDVRTGLTSSQKEEKELSERRRRRMINEDEKELDREVERRKEEEWEREREKEREVGIRICRDCREVTLRKQYRLGSDRIPRYLQKYETLMQLQKEIEQSLPEFQEMVLGLQKQDTSTALGSSSRAALSLQRDAAQARKQLLANFANYDRLAKEIRNLPEERDEQEEETDPGGSGSGKEVQKDGAQKRVKQAIFMRANLFLQQNMFPLQRLPKPGENQKPVSLESPTSSQNGDVPSSSNSNLTEINATSPPSRTLRSLLVGSGSKLLPPLENGHSTPLPRVGSSGIDPTISIPDLKIQLSVLVEQRENVERFASSAERARKFDDANTLRRSVEDLLKEENRYRNRLRELGEI